MKLNKKELLEQLTLNEKAALLSGTDFMYTNSVPRLNIPSLCMADGPHGLRKQIGEQDNGISKSQPATAFPTAATTASSWNSANLQKMGQAIADECLYYGVNILLGPAVNIKRDARCGRNFEYFSEDPLLAGTLGAEFVKGVQSKNVGVSVKHFAANNSENFRFMGNSVVDLRALREIYLKVYELIVKNSQPYTMMCAYNQINGVFCSDNKWLLGDVLRKEWGFDGIVMSDWGAVHNRVEAVKAGLDLEMPGDTHCRKQIVDAVKDANLPQKQLDTAVENILTLIERCCRQQKVQSFDKTAHHSLACDIAVDSAVLLKNNGCLPLDKKQQLLVVGELFEKMRYQGAGSSMICPTMLTTPKDAFDDHKIDYVYQKGYLENSYQTDQKLLQSAIDASMQFDKVVVFAGLTDYAESEGCDRQNLKLPQNQIELIETLVRANKKIVLVLFGGSPVELPFVDGVDAILNMYLPGQNGGQAVTKLLFGQACPSGKLAETWTKSTSDIVFGQDYSTSINEIYRESIFVGYRYYQSASQKVLFPFGFGLSYTTFEYSNLTVQESDSHFTATCDIHNSGKCDGAEIVQLYVKNNANSKVFKAQKELKAFEKVYLKAGQTKTVSLTFEKSQLGYFNVELDNWVLENGTYQVQICASLTDVRLTKDFEITGQNEVECPYSQEVNQIFKSFDLEQVSDAVFEKMSNQKIPTIAPTLPLTLESRFSDFQKTFMGRILFNAITGVAKKQHKKALKMPKGTARDNSIKGAVFLYRILESNSMRSFCMSAGKALPINLAEGMVLLANGRIFKGFKRILKKEKLSALPSAAAKNKKGGKKS